MKKQPVKCLNDNKVYASLTDAAAAYFINTGNISRVCRGLLPHTSGLKFEFIQGGKDNDNR